MPAPGTFHAPGRPHERRPLVVERAARWRDAVGEHAGYEYARTSNPTRRALEECNGEPAEAIIKLMGG